MIDTPSAIRPAFLSNPEKRHFVDGKWQSSVTGEAIKTFNPATGKVLATVRAAAKTTSTRQSPQRAEHLRGLGAGSLRMSAMH